MYIEKDIEENQYSRTAILIGDEGIKKLSNATVAVFGSGGVGSFVIEALARAGIGNIVIFDGDVVAASNLNRQIVALHSTIGQPKAKVMADRVKDINSYINVTANVVFYTSENADDYPLECYDYIVDAIDMVSAKIELITRAHNLGIPIISSMGTGNKLDPSKFEVSDIYKTEVCPLARVMRRELKQRGVKKLKTVYSKEIPITNSRPCGSISFVPSSAGLLIAGEVIKEIVNI